MDFYKPPESDVEIETGRAFKPIKAIVLGLLVSMALSMVVSVIEVIIFAVILKLDLSDAKALNLLTGKNTTFQIVDTIITFLILFFAGRVVRKYAPGKEVLVGLIVASLTFVFALYMTISSGGFVTGPVWYNVASLLSIFVAIYLGSNPTGKVS